MKKNNNMKFRKQYMTLLELLIGMALTMALLATLTYFYQQIDQLNTATEKTQKEIFHLHYVENRLNRVIPRVCAEKTKDFYFFSSTISHGVLAEGSPSLIFQYETGPDFDDTLAVTALGRLFLDRNKRLCLASWPDPAESSMEQSKPRIEVLLENVNSLAFQFYVAPDRDRSIVTNQTSADNKTPENANEKTPDPNAPKQEPPAQGGNQNQKKPPKPDEDPNKSKEAQKDQTTPAPEEKPNETDNIDSSLQIEPEPKGTWIPEWDKKYKHLPALLKIVITQEGKEKPIVLAYPFLKSNKVIVYEQ